MRRLATWPEGGERSDYASILRDALLARYNRLILEPMVLCYNLLHPDQPETDDPGKPPIRIAHDEARVKVWGDGKLLATTIAHGPNPRAAKVEAELMALREAALGRSDVPMLGILDRNDRITLSMVHEDGHYWLILDQDMSDHPLYGPRLLPREEYRMRVRIKAFDKKRGTRYALAMRIHDDIRELLMRTMDVHRSDYVQRVVLALPGHHISGLSELHDLRTSIPVKLLEGEIREAHHHNGHGLDNRRANLLPLEVHVHNATHAISPLGFKYGCLSKPVPDADRGDPLLWMPGPTLITPYGVMGQQGYDALFPPKWGDEGTDEGLSEPPSWDNLPRCVTRAEIAAMAHKETHKDKLSQALAALVEADGQGMLSNLKSSKWIDGKMSENTLRRTLRLLAENGIVASSRLGGATSDDERNRRAGVSEHYRLVRPLAMTFFGPMKRGQPALP
jgi:DNA-binding transcriptional ArsR family regulator